MPKSVGPVNVAILAVPEVSASALFGLIDLFSSPGRDFEFITRGIPGEQRMRPYIVAKNKNGFSAANGIRVQPEYEFSDCPKPEFVCIPDFFVNPRESITGLYDPEALWLKEIHGDGAILSSSCSGAVLLGEAGLLANCDATTHWGYVRMLTDNYPTVKVHPHRSLVLSGDAQRIVMAGGGSSWQDLALYLIARFIGLKEALEVARVHLLQWHDLGQQPFSALMYFHQTQDGVINRCQEWSADHYKLSSPVAAMIEFSGLPDRSFMRRFTEATGMTPLDYVHALRLEEAKQMLETGDLSVEAIANEVGYEDTGFFGRLFRRKVGMTPAHYRLRFGSLRRAMARH
jgi:transcriptional regulator GlxA family with amidase domain